MIKNIIRRVTACLASLAIVSLLGCGSGQGIGGDSAAVSRVKKGLWQGDRTVRIGDAFDGYKYFSNKQWKAFQTDQKRTLVEFRGQIILDALKGTRISNPFSVVPGNQFYDESAIAKSKEFINSAFFGQYLSTFSPTFLQALFGKCVNGPS